MIFRKTLRRMLAMCPAAWAVSIRTLQLGCVLLLGAILLLIRCDGDLMGRYELYISAMSLNEACQSVLLVGTIAGVCIEDLKTRAR